QLRDIPANAKTAEVKLYLVANDTNGSGTIYADKLSLVYTTDNNLLDNASFENVNGTKPVRWETSLPSGATGTFSTISTPVAAGSRAVRIAASGLSQWNDAAVQQEVPVTAGRGYKLSGKLNVEALNQGLGQVFIRFYNDSYQMLGENHTDYNALTNGYGDIDLQGMIPAGTTRATVRVAVLANANGGAGTVSVDDMRLEYTAGADTNLVKNGDFEIATVNGATNWTQEITPNAATGSVSLVSTPVYAGTKAYRIAATGIPAWENANISQRIDVEGGKRYLLTNHLKVESLTRAQVEMSVRFYDANQQYIGQNQTVFKELTNDYITLEQLRDIPANAKTAEVKLYLVANDTNGSGTIYADKLSLVYTTDNNLLDNASFENVNGTKPVGWETSLPSGATGTFSTISTPVTAGSRAVRIAASGLPQWNDAAVQQEVPVTAGRGYKLSGKLNVEALNQSLGQVFIRFYNDSYQMLGENHTDYNALTNGYGDIDLQGMIPAGTTRATVRVAVLANANGGAGTVSVDDMRLEYTAGADANLIKNGDLEIATMNGATNWTQEITPNAATGSVSLVSTPVYAGTKAYRIAATGIPAWENANISQR
ncbi:carbohydrate binding domain-containing protein, partial [Cohnella sp. GCM10020058]|uniref:carbohydrate binding domain-containing protein n=1 Tax=Cohnella sp. GCM10020058 TaxID=3317330 RepID=UPI00363DA083